MKVALYLRVSTARQAEKDLSIPDQRNRLEAWCRDKGWTVAAEFVEPGASATDEKRPQFQRMMDDATRKDRPFDAVLVHSFSRFFRDAFKFELHRRALERNNVTLISITQAVAEDSAGQMIRQIYAIFDEHQSRENAKHVSRAMQANARLGFWNGSVAPFGYRTETTEVRADAHKKRLVIVPGEAEIVRQIFELCLEDMGCRVIAHEINKRGFTLRGRAFTTNRVHEILKRETYAGTHYYNRTHAKTRRRRERDEWIAVETPVIIEPHIFQEVQRRLDARRPSRVPARVVTTPVLLTGLARCATCSGTMRLNYGKYARYRYYSCHSGMHRGAAACKGRAIPMQVLDDLVMDAMESRIFAPERLEELLSALVARKNSNDAAHAGRAKLLRKALAEVEGKIERSLGALTDGMVSDTDLLRKHHAGLEAEREETLRLIAALDAERSVPRQLLSRENLSRFAANARSRLRSDNVRHRQRYIRMFLERVEVGDDTITLRGPKPHLVTALSGESGGGSADRRVLCLSSAGPPFSPGKTSSEPRPAD
jgi:site-specific DNA recombinase